jgi:hypothetical protein
MEIDLQMPILYKMLNSIKDIEDFAHYNILKKYMVKVDLYDQNGLMRIKPQVINLTNVTRAHKM